MGLKMALTLAGTNQGVFVPSFVTLYVQHSITGAWCEAGTADAKGLLEWLEKKLKQ